MIEESLPCLPGPLYRAVPQRIVGDGRSPRLRLRARYAGCSRHTKFSDERRSRGLRP
jgi:hypothetical protein